MPESDAVTVAFTFQVDAEKAQEIMAQLGVNNNSPGRAQVGSVPRIQVVQNSDSSETSYTLLKVEKLVKMNLIRWYKHSGTSDRDQSPNACTYRPSLTELKVNKQWKDEKLKDVTHLWEKVPCIAGNQKFSAICFKYFYDNAVFKTLVMKSKQKGHKELLAKKYLEIGAIFIDEDDGSQTTVFAALLKALLTQWERDDEGLTTFFTKIASDSPTQKIASQEQLRTVQEQWRTEKINYPKRHNVTRRKKKPPGSRDSPDELEWANSYYRYIWETVSEAKNKQNDQPDDTSRQEVLWKYLSDQCWAFMTQPVKGKKNSQVWADENITVELIQAKCSRSNFTEQEIYDWTIDLVQDSKETRKTYMKQCLRRFNEGRQKKKKSLKKFNDFENAFQTIIVNIRDAYTSASS
jgi:hypothetical protein